MINSDLLDATSSELMFVKACLVFELLPLVSSRKIVSSVVLLHRLGDVLARLGDSMSASVLFKEAGKVAAASPYIPAFDFLGEWFKPSVGMATWSPA